MGLQISGLLKNILPLEQGLSKAGAEWQKQLFIVSNNEGYEGKEQLFCFEVFGSEKVDNFNKFNKVGDSVTVDFNINTNEWKGKYFTSLQSWKITKNENSTQINAGGTKPTFEPVTNFNEEEFDDLPFS